MHAKIMPPTHPSRSSSLPFLALLAALSSGAPSAHADPYRISRLEQRVRFLSSGAFEGRASGEKGGDRAGAYLAGEVARLGLAPGFPGGSFLQPFPVILGTETGAGNALEIGGRKRHMGKDFMPFSYSDNGSLDAEVVFAGYGISAPKLGYDDFEGVDVKGKLLLIFDGEPRERDRTSAFRSPEAYRFRELRHKAWQARERGAAGLLVVGPRRRARRAIFAKGKGRAGSRAGLLVVNLAGHVAQDLIPGKGTTLETLAKAIDRTGKPASRALGTTVKVTVDLSERRGVGYNVAARLRGTGSGREQVVVGAHYDHLGHGGPGSLAPGSKRIHYGADDNASGVAAVLAVAESMLATPPERDVLFMGFAAEEMGLLGSRYFVEHYPEDAPRTTAMLNLDMVGRMRDDRLLVFGVDTGVGLRSLVREQVAATKVKAAFSGDGYGPSDHTAFFSAGIPVLHLFTGPHESYHRPSDKYKTLNYPGLARIARLTESMTRKLADLPKALAHQAPKAPHGKPGATAPRGHGEKRAGSGGSGHGAGKAHGYSHGHGHGGGGPPGGAGRSKGYGAYFGSVPDFSQTEGGGVRLQGVREGSPAAKAGVRSGDTITSMDGKRVENLMDFTFVLRSLRPGDKVDLVVQRDGKERRLRATLGDRR